MKSYDLWLSRPIEINAEIWSGSEGGVVISITDNNGFDGAKIPLADIKVLLFPDDDESHVLARDKLARALLDLIERVQNGDGVDIC